MKTEASTRYLALTAMSLLYFLLMAGTFNALGVILPLMVGDIGMNWAEAGLGFTLLGVACGIASLVPAILIRRIGVSRMLLAGAITLAAGFMCLAVARSTLAYHIGTTLMGLGFCFCGTVPGIHVISSLFEKRSTALGIYFTAGGLGSVTGPVLFFLMNSVMGDWRGFWVAFAITALVLGVFAAVVTSGRKVDAPVENEADEAAATSVDAAGWTARDVFRTPQFWVVVVSYAGCLLINTTMHSFAVQHLQERGLSLGAAAGLISASAMIGAVSSGLAGVIGERIAPKTLTIVALTALSVAALSLVLPQTGATLALFAIALGLGLGVSYVGTAMLLLDQFGRKPNLEIYSLMCMVSTSAAIGPVLAGLQRDKSGSFVSVFVCLAAIGAVLSVILMLTKRPVLAVAVEPADESDIATVPTFA